MKRIVETIFLLSSIGGATLVALNIGLQFWGYLIFLISSLASVYLILISNVSRAMLTTTVVYIIINIVGIWRS